MSHSPQALAWGYGALSRFRNRFNGLPIVRMNKNVELTFGVELDWPKTRNPLKRFHNIGSLR